MLIIRRCAEINASEEDDCGMAEFDDGVEMNTYNYLYNYLQAMKTSNELRYILAYMGDAPVCFPGPGPITVWV